MIGAPVQDREARAEEAALTRADFPHIAPVTTRWNDNDPYGHLNNVVYYELFDSAVNAYVIAEGGLDIHAGPAIGLVVESGCRYHRAVGYPQALEVGIRVVRLGGSSVTYVIAVFEAGVELPAATGHFIHVYVDRETRRPVPIPEPMRAAMARLVVEASGTD